MKYLILLFLAGCASKDLSRFKFKPSPTATLIPTSELGQCSGATYEDIENMSWCEQGNTINYNHFTE